MKQMLHSMYSAKGIGLAAPQVGINKQLLVIDLDFENSKACTTFLHPAFDKEWINMIKIETKNAQG